MRRRLPVLFTAAALCLSQTAQAVDFWMVLGSTGGKSTLRGGEFVYPTSDGKTTLWVGISFLDFMNNEGNEIDLTGFKTGGPFTQSELALLANEVVKVSRECYNLSATRDADIKQWLTTTRVEEANFYTTALRPTAQKSFGPLELSLTKTVNGNSHAVAVHFYREGQQGVAPWTKTCTASG
ncbi:hypothetical protein [Deinococcus sp. SL84]|uniref:hypothetical protein n=1 Tax=Deinococcus sp. SL84 TaxID=2994663 RepID=UPI002272B303|nr:hypothetical protein [Deinococcus sp. SL84]MCY1703692.1 hypothetical protein [Deinococcus sp. SL84]